MDARGAGQSEEQPNPGFSSLDARYACARSGGIGNRGKAIFVRSETHAGKSIEFFRPGLADPVANRDSGGLGGGHDHDS